MECLRTAIILSGNSFCLFDSNSRDERGLSVADETLVLMKFGYLYEIDRQQVHFQLQIIEVTVGLIESSRHLFTVC